MSRSQTRGFSHLIHEEAPTGAKVELETRPSAQTEGAEASFAAIVRVNRAEYIPAGVKLRARITAHIFTAQLTPATLQRLQADPAVVSISRSERVRLE